MAVCVCVCHGACHPVLKNIQLPYKECSITITISISERRLRVSYLYCLTKTSIHTLTCAKAQPLTARARRCSGDPLRECPSTIAYHCHHPSSFPFIDCVGTSIVQGLIGVPLPTPPSAIRLSKTPTLPFIQLRVLGIRCALIFFPSGLIKRREKKKK